MKSEKILKRIILDLKLYEVVKKDCFIQNTQDEIKPHKRCSQFSYDENMIIIEKSAFEYPTSGDANGAYNIARKGVMMLERIEKNPEKPDLLIRDADWDSWDK